MNTGPGGGPSTFGHEWPTRRKLGRLIEADFSDRDLILRAAATINPRRGPGGRHFGGVAACLLSSTRNLYLGVDIDTGSGTGFCAEHSAIAAMVTAGEYLIATIVAVWRDDSGQLYVLPPCGRCRELIRQLNSANWDTKIVLSNETVVRLADLLPHSEPAGSSPNVERANARLS